MLKKIASFDGEHIAYDIQRNRTRWYLVFLHGAGGDLAAWAAERTYFHRRGISTIAIDLRGHGMSSRPTSHQAYALDNFARDVREVIRHEHIRRYVLVGHCFGGMVAINYQKLFPNHPRSYVLVDTTDKAPLELELLAHIPFLSLILNMLLDHGLLADRASGHTDYGPFIGTRDFDIKRLYSDIHHMSLRSWLYVYETISSFNGLAALHSMTRPVLVVHGKDDRIFSEEAAKDIQQQLVDGRLDLIPHANHIIVLNNPDALVLEIWRFLNEIRRQVRIHLVGKRSFRWWLRTVDIPVEQSLT